MSRMSKMNTGGPAFPTETGAAISDRQGMTLRDYFAAKALQGILANNNDVLWGGDDVTDIAYELADAMLKAREGK